MGLGLGRGLHLGAGVGVVAASGIGRGAWGVGRWGVGAGACAGWSTRLTDDGLIGRLLAVRPEQRDHHALGQPAAGGGGARHGRGL